MNPTDLYIIGCAVLVAISGVSYLARLFFPRTQRAARSRSLGQCIAEERLKQRLRTSFPSHPSEKPPAFPDSLRSLTTGTPKH
ncbi:MAG: hypothetical protein AAGB14_04520 [Verrucomicrobiota bacterium]